MRKLVQTGATEFQTPLGAIRVVGPYGRVPFSVSQCPVPDCYETTIKHYYTLRIALDDLSEGERYTVEFDGPALHRPDSDHYGQIYEVSENGITVGISGANPNEDNFSWPEGPTPDLKGYYIVWDDPREGWFTIVKCKDPDRFDGVYLDVGWLSTAQDPDDILSLVLFY